MTIFAPSHGARSSAKILFAIGEKDERAKMTANEFILYECVHPNDAARSEAPKTPENPCRA
jgi:hypothetical protein